MDTEPLQVQGDNASTHPKQLNPQNCKTQSVISSDLKHPMILQGESYQSYQPQTPNSKLLWSEAQDLIKIDKIQEALPLLKKCIELNPSIDDQFIGLGCFEDRVGRHYSTLWDWVCLCKEWHKKQSSPYDLLSLCISVSEEPNHHKQWYQKMLESYPKNYKLQFGMANLQYNCKRFKEAQELYKGVLDISHNNAQVYQRISFIYCLKWNRDSEAIKWAEETLRCDQDNVYAMLIRALCNKDLDQRVRMLSELIENKPNYARPYNGLGNAYYNQKRYEKAINSYKRCIEVNRLYEHPYYGLGSIYNQLGDLDESIHWYKMCIEVSPNYDYPHYGLGIAYNNKNDAVNAIHWFKECIRINPAYDCPYYALGNIYRLAKEYRQAIDYYQQSIQIKAIDPLCFVNIALAHISLQDFQIGLQYLQKAQRYLDEDKMLSTANIEYIKQQLDHFLRQVKKHERSCLGFITLRERIAIKQTTAKFKEQFTNIYKKE